MKQSVRNHLIYNWWKYIVVAALIIAVWLYIFDVISDPAANEQINITFVGTELKNTLLQEDILNDIDELQGEQQIKEVSIECLSTDDEYTLNTVLAIRVTDETDFVIMQESTVENFEVESYFISLTADQVTENFGNAETYEKDGVIYGIKLSGDNVFSRYYTGDENCYAFITSVSVNFGGINGSGNASDRACINLINYLLEADV